jgi:hypothetical protein
MEMPMERFLKDNLTILFRKTKKGFDFFAVDSNNPKVIKWYNGRWTLRREHKIAETITDVREAKLLWDKLISIGYRILSEDSKKIQDHFVSIHYTLYDYVIKLRDKLLNDNTPRPPP